MIEEADLTEYADCRKTVSKDDRRLVVLRSYCDRNRMQVTSGLGSPGHKS